MEPEKETEVESKDAPEAVKLDVPTHGAPGQLLSYAPNRKLVRIDENTITFVDESPQALPAQELKRKGEK